MEMAHEINRREFLKLTGLGSVGVVFASALPGMASAAAQDDFYFVQLSDSHWGFEGPPNPDAKVFKEFFGATNYTFDHKGVHFIALDNVSDPRALIGDEQLAWLAADLKRQKTEAPIVVLTHRPLFDLAPQWDWATRDGAKAVELLMPYRNVTVFYGHIHQEHHHMTGHIAHHAAKGLMFPLPAPGSQPNRTPLPWNPAEPYKGLGFRGIDAELKDADYKIIEYPVVRKA